MVSQMYPADFNLNKANTFDTETSLLDLRLSILDGFVSSKIFDKRDDFDFDSVNFPFLTVIVRAPLLMEFTSPSTFALLGCLVLSLISMRVIKN